MAKMTISALDAAAQAVTHWERRNLPPEWQAYSEAQLAIINGKLCVAVRFIPGAAVQYFIAENPETGRAPDFVAARDWATNWATD